MITFAENCKQSKVKKRINYILEKGIEEKKGEKPSSELCGTADMQIGGWLWWNHSSVEK